MGTQEEKGIDQLIYEETEHRLSVMEQPGYEFPSQFGRADVIGVAVSVCVSVVSLILCATGVIL